MTKMAQAPVPNNRLKDARETLGWSQEYVAKQIGTTAPNVSRWERGITAPAPYYRDKLSELFGKSANALGLVKEPADITAAETDGAAQRTTFLDDPLIPLRPPFLLVGREPLLARLKKQLMGGNSVILSAALSGLPGVGKTALAIELAHDTEIRRSFRGGILWAAVGPESPTFAELSRWGALLGVSVPVNETTNVDVWAKVLRAAIGSRRFLLVIDDIWSLEAALAFKVGGPQCNYLVTTRFPELALSFAMEGAIRVEELTEEHSLALLERIVPAVIANEPEKVRTLLQAVGGLPLALTLTGKYLYRQARSGQTHRIQAALDQLQRSEERLRLTEVVAPLDRPPYMKDGALSLQATIAVSLQYLDEQAQEVLHALAHFPPKPNTFSQEAALAVAATSLDTLDRVVETGLLEPRGGDRYTLHQLIADYVRTQPTDREAEERLLTYFTVFAQTHAHDEQRLEQELPNLLAALELASQRGDSLALAKTLSALSYFLASRSLFSVVDRYLRAGEAFMQATTSDFLEDVTYFALALAYRAAASDELSHEEYSRLLPVFQKGLQAATSLRQDALHLQYLDLLRRLEDEHGSLERAEHYGQEGLTLARRVGDWAYQIRNLSFLASCAGYERGEYAQAYLLVAEGLDLARKMQDSYLQAYLQQGLGRLLFLQGEYEQAATVLQEAHVLARRQKRLMLTMIVLTSQAENALWGGNDEQVTTYLQEGLALADQLKDQVVTCDFLQIQGYHHLKHQRILLAEDVLIQVLSFLEDIFPTGPYSKEAKVIQAKALVALAHCAYTAGDAQKAQHHARLGASLLDELGWRGVTRDGKTRMRQWLNACFSQ